MHSLFKQIGGDDTIEKIVDIMYHEVMGDERLAAFFDGVDMSQQQRKFRMFLHALTDGPLQNSGLEIRAAHAKVVSQGLSRGHVEGMFDHLRLAMKNAEVRSELADQVLCRMEAFSGDALGQ